MSKFFIVAVVFVLLIVLREVWRVAMAFYNARQVRSIMMEGWYQWSIHGCRLPVMKRLGVLFSLLSLYEESGVEILPGFLDQEGVLKFMDENEGLTEEELVQITDRIFRLVSKIREGGEAVA